MNCPSCGAHVPTPRKRRRPASFESRRYKRAWMRAKRAGLEFHAYILRERAACRAGRKHDRDAVELGIPQRRRAS